MVVVMALKRKEKKERYSNRGQLRVTLGYSPSPRGGVGDGHGSP